MGIGWYLNSRRLPDAAFSMSAALVCLIAPKVGISPFEWVPHKDISAVYLSIFGTTATLLGFVIASATFLAAHTRSPEFAILRRSSSYGQLFQIFNSSTWRLAFLMIVTATLSRCSAHFAMASNFIVLLASMYATPSLLTLFWVTLRILQVRSHN